MAPQSVRSVCDRGRLVIGWMSKNLLSRAPPCFGRHVKPLIPAAFAVVNTDRSALGRVVGYGSFSLWVILKACAPALIG
jgi:hypothetical protein